MDVGSEISKKIKDAIKAKLQELGSHVDNELPDYIMVMVANKKSKEQMTDDLQLFLGTATSRFTEWLHALLEKLQSITAKARQQTAVATAALKQNPGQEAKELLDREIKRKQGKTDSKKSAEKKSFKQQQKSSSSRRGLINTDFSQKQIKIKVKKETDSELKKGETYTESSLQTDIDKTAERSIITKIESLDRLKPAAKSELRKHEKQDRKRKTSEDDTSCKRKAGGLGLFKNLESDESHVHSAVRAQVTHEPKVRALQDAQVPDIEIKTELKVKKEKSIVPENVTEACDQPGSNDGKGLNVVAAKSAENSDRVKISHSVKKSNSKRNVKKVLTSSAEDVLQLTTEHDEFAEEGELAGNSDIKSHEVFAVKLEGEQKKVAQSRPKQKSTEVVLTAQQEKSSALTTTAPAVAGAGRKRAFSEHESFAVEKKSRQSPETKQLQQLNSSNTKKLTATVRQSQAVANTCSKDIKPPLYLPATAVQPAAGETVVTASVSSTLTSKKQPSAVKATGKEADLEVKTTSVKAIGSRIVQVSVPKHRVAAKSILRGSDKHDTDTRTVLQPSARDLFLRSQEFLASDEDEHMPDLVHATMDSPESEEATVSAERCRYWPACRAGDSCIYVHPSQPCRSFPNCKFGDRCFFIHPNCKFDARCLQPSCPYTHSLGKQTRAALPTPAVLYRAPLRVAQSAPPVYSTPCKFGSSCSKYNCPFQHTMPCRWGAQCQNLPHCRFQHPPKSSVSLSLQPKVVAPFSLSTDKYKWSKDSGEMPL